MNKHTRITKRGELNSITNYLKGLTALALLLLTITSQPVQAIKQTQDGLLPKRLTVLVTGFESFSGRDTNVTEELIKYLPDSIKGATLHTHVLPVVYNEAGEELAALINKIEPDIVLSLGETRLDGDFRIDNYAKNLVHSKGKDNKGQQLYDTLAVKDGPELYQTKLSQDELIQTLGEAQFNIFEADKPSGYVCNNLFYHLMDTVHHASIQTAGFVHVDKTEDPGELQRLADGVQLMVETEVQQYTKK